MDTVLNALTDKILARPVILTAGSMFAALILTYYTSSIYPSLIFSLLSLALCTLFRELRRIMVIIIFLSIFTVLLSVYMVRTLKVEVNTGRYEGEVFILSAEYSLSGGNRYSVRTDTGANAVINEYSTSYLSAGDRAYVRGRIEPAETATNPGQFDHREYLRKKGIVCVIYPDEIQSELYRPSSWLLTARKWLYGAVTDDMDEEERSLFAAICLGDKSLLDRKLISSFNLSSCSHLIAVSGAHFSGFMTSLVFLAESIFSEKVRRKKSYKVSLSICYILLGFLTGFGDSVTRACVMCICLVFMRDRLSAMCTSAVIMMLADPFAVVSSGFLMSMSATLGILLFSGRIGRRLPGPLAVALSAHIGLMPFFVSSGMRLSPVNLLCQLIGGLAVSMICIFLLPTVIFCLMFGTVFAIPIEVMLGFLIRIVSFCAGSSHLSINCGRAGNAVIFGLYALIIVFFLPDCILRKAALLPALAAGGIAAGILIYDLFFPPAMTTVFADVGQGDCCIIMTPSYCVMIDGGTSDKGDEVADILDWYGVGQVDLAFVSHWDKDHCGGIVSLCNEGRIDTVLAPRADDSVGNVVAVGSGCTITVEDAEFRVISPDVMTGDDNDDSLVIEVICNGMKMLFSGDISSLREERLIEEGVLEDCDILKVSHHGSRFSTSDIFLDVVRPETAIVSCGRNNSYGHPHEETLERLRSHGITIRRTDAEGAICVAC
ncbi:MAG: ComEC/Rec2 family competence protein [Clostridiales bacterium]|nr:ComEC/Rec2 family competence protein [Clostridiales bacterium]